MRQKQSEFWFFTFNESKEEKLPSPSDFYKLLTESDDTIDYAKFQLEAGEAKARNHYQGVFHSGRRVHERLRLRIQPKLPGLHLEPARSWAACVEYVSKAHTRLDGPWEYGQPPRVGRGLGGGQQQNTYPPRPDPWAKRTVVIITGPPGIGKTYQVRSFCRDKNLSLYAVSERAKQSSGRWIGPYAGQPAVLIDEFEYSDFSRGQWLTLLDAYDTNVTSSMGGKTVMWQPQYIFMTCNHLHHIERLLQDPAIRRRISRVENYHKWAPPYSKPQQHATIFQETSVQPEEDGDEEIPDPEESEEDQPPRKRHCRR